MRTIEEVEKELESRPEIGNECDYQDGYTAALLAVLPDYEGIIDFNEAAIERELDTHETLQFVKHSVNWKMGYWGALEWVLGKTDKCKKPATGK
jgi:hypothetical protein